MPSFSKALNSQVGRKFMTGLTGVALMLFLIVHLAGNLTLFASDGAFNAYTHKLESLGPLLYVAEAILAFLFLYHAVLGINIWLHKRRARGSRYEVYKTKGGPSHQSLASKSMVFTGIVILVFLVAHIIHFKFGAYYETTLDGETVRDLKRLVLESFSRPLDTFLYVGVLLLVILHLSHGFWSAFTSLGMKSGNTSKKMQMIAYGFAIVLMGAFMFIPLYIFFAGPDASLIAN